MFNRTEFYRNIRNPLFNGGMEQGQVDGTNSILDYWDETHPDDPVEFLAYILATSYHETAHSMRAVRESGGDKYYHRMYDINGQRPHIAKRLGNDSPGDGICYHGRGHVQLTGKRNYAHQSTKVGTDLLENPDAALDDDVSVAILIEGMLDGDFSGRKLADYWRNDSFDFIAARAIVNGKDCADKIAGYYRYFLAAIVAAVAQTEATNPIHAQFPEPITPFEQHPQGVAVADTSVATATKSWYQSKIVLTALGTVISLLATRFGLEIDATRMTDLLLGISTGGLTIATIFRIFATTTLIKR